MSKSLLFKKLIILCIISINSHVISGHGIHLLHGDHSIDYKPQEEHIKFNCLHGTFVYKDDCTMFIECFNGQVSIKQCAPGTAFDKDRLFCEAIHKAKCDYWSTTNYKNNSSLKETNDILCPPGTVGRYPYPFDGHYYLECLESKTIIQNCPNDMKFNATQGKCITVNIPHIRHSNNNDLYHSLYKCPNYRSNDREMHFYPFNATKYIECSWGQLTVVDCDPLKVFSYSRKTCLPKNQVPHFDHVHTPSTTPANVPVRHDDIIYCPMDLFGLYPHPFSDGKYLKCAYGRLFDKSCRTGFIYNGFSQMCERNVTNLFKRLPTIWNLNTTESTIEIRTNDTLTFLKCPADFEGTFIHPFNCTKYINCSPAGTNIGTCPPGEIYSFRKGKCGFESEMDTYDHVECIQNVENQDPEESYSLGVNCTNIATMKFPHPDNWHKYILCNDGELQIKLCPRNEVFNLESRECIDETEAVEM